MDEEANHHLDRWIAMTSRAGVLAAQMAQVNADLVELATELVKTRTGCTTTHFLENHHITHWSKGGTTDIDTLVSLCPRHHREHHQDQFSIHGDPTTRSRYYAWSHDHGGRRRRAGCR